jgi:hypothetical protein
MVADEIDLRAFRPEPAPPPAEGDPMVSEAEAGKTGKDLGRALEHLAAGQWQPAHEIVQGDSSKLASWLHGIVHILEGDMDNARGWYKRAERDFPGGDAAPAEIAAAREAMRDARS